MRNSALTLGLDRASSTWGLLTLRRIATQGVCEAGGADAGSWADCVLYSAGVSYHEPWRQARPKGGVLPRFEEGSVYIVGHL